MKTPMTSRGAPYVAKLPTVMFGYDPDDLPVLIWSPWRSLFVNKEGKAEEMYGLREAEAEAICKLTGVKFTNSYLRWRE